MKKILLILLALLLLTGCESYEDTNGDDDYSLQTLKLEDVFDGHSSSSGGSTTAPLLFGTGASIKASSLNGITDVVEFDTYDYGWDDFTLTISFRITKGNGALVIRSMTDILYEAVVNQDDQVFEISGDDMPVYITVYGESLDYELDWEYYDGLYIPLG